MDAREIAKDLVECYHRFSDPSHTFNTLEDPRTNQNSGTWSGEMFNSFSDFLASDPENFRDDGLKFQLE